MRENVIIAYHGASYELGQWPQGYGIWRAGTPQSEPLEWWPPTPEGWSAAWYRFAAIEIPGTIVAAEAGGASGPPAAAAPGTGASDLATAPPATSASAVAASPDAAAAAATGIGTGASFAATAPMTAATPVGSGPVFPGSVSLGGGPGPGGLAPGSAVQAQPAAEPAIGASRARVAAALLGVGVILGIVGLFPNYLAGQSLASQSANLVPHLFYLVAWALSAAFIVRGGRLLRPGALLGVGTSAVTFGFFFADIGTPMADGASVLGAGLIIGLFGWLLCAAGSALAFGRWPAGWPRQPVGREVAIVALLVAAAIGTAITFAPSWDSYLLRVSTGASQLVTLGNAFSNPAPIIVGDVAVMVALVAIVALAAFWRPARLGWALVAGAAAPMVAQAISAFIAVGQPTPPGLFGFSQSAASRAGLTISNGLTAVFWVYCVFLVALIAVGVWLAFNKEEAGHSAAYGAHAGFGVPAGYGSHYGTVPYGAPHGAPAAQWAPGANTGTGTTLAGEPAPGEASPAAGEPAASAVSEQGATPADSPVNGLGGGQPTGSAGN